MADFTWNSRSNKNVDSLKADLNLNYGKTLRVLLVYWTHRRQDDGRRHQGEEQLLDGLTQIYASIFFTS